MSVGKDRCITFWDIRCPQPQLIVQNAHAGDVTAVGLAKTGSIFATGGADKVSTTVSVCLLVPPSFPDVPNTLLQWLQSIALDTSDAVHVIDCARNRHLGINFG